MLYRRWLPLQAVSASPQLSICKATMKYNYKYSIKIQIIPKINFTFILNYKQITRIMPDSQNAMENIIDPDKNTIPLGTAMTRTTAWRHWAQGVSPAPELPLSFYIDIDDILNLADMYTRNPTVIAGYRAYLAKNEEIDFPFKLLFVAVGPDMADILNEIPENSPVAPPIDPLMPSRIYDFSVPCPNTCHDSSSPLVTGIFPQSPQK